MLCVAVDLSLCCLEATPLEAACSGGTQLTLCFPLAQHSEDCLHYAVGTGVFEGWTDYIAYFLRSRWRGDGDLAPLDV